jgi:hypothetical protein
MRDYGFTTKGRPRKLPWRPQENNPQLHAAARLSQCKPGNANRPRCTAQRACGRGPCKSLAVKGANLCYRHGGWRFIPKRRLEENRKRKALRYARWTLNRSQEKWANETHHIHAGNEYQIGRDM